MTTKQKDRPLSTWAPERILQAAAAGVLQVNRFRRRLGDRALFPSEERALTALLEGGYLCRGKTADGRTDYRLTYDGRTLLDQWQRYIPLGGGQR